MEKMQVSEQHSHAAEYGWKDKLEHGKNPIGKEGHLLSEEYR
jgi:hypothetical protein